MIAERLPVDARPFARVFEEQRNRYRAEPYMPLETRKTNLARLERAIRHQRGALRSALAADLGRAAHETELTEVNFTLAELRHARAHLAAWMKPQHAGTPRSLFGSRAQLHYEPKGVVLILAPWNYPVQSTFAPLAAALAAGNRCIVRPSEKTPRTRDVIAAIVAEAFVPHDVAYVGGDVETAEALLRLPFDHIFFTGSSRVGKLVMRAAAEHLASVTLELGGKSPCVVHADADVPLAARRIAWGKFVNAGQTCIAPDYVLVHESLERAFLGDLSRSIAAMYGASEAARAATPDFARMIDDEHFTRVESVLAATIRRGATVEIGGKTNRAARYIAPTVLSNLDFDAPIMNAEIFGPVLPVLTYASLDDAMLEINRRPKPLALYAFTRTADVEGRVLRGTSAGGTLINDTVVHCSNPYLPFGGVGESGFGNYHGRFGFETFSHERAVMRQSKASLASWLAPPYGAKTRAALALLRRLS